MPSSFPYIKTSKTFLPKCWCKSEQIHFSSFVVLLEKVLIMSHSEQWRNVENTQSEKRTNKEKNTMIEGYYEDLWVYWNSRMYEILSRVK